MCIQMRIISSSVLFLSNFEQNLIDGDVARYHCFLFSFVHSHSTADLASGIRIAFGAIVYDDALKATALSQHWAPIFDHLLRKSDF